MFRKNREILTCTADTDIIRLNNETNTVREFVRSGALRQNGAGQYYLHDDTARTATVNIGQATVLGVLPTSNTAGLAAPVQAAPTTLTSGGALLAATYFYVVTALNAAGESLKSNEASLATTGASSSNTISWGAVSGATRYRIYRGTATGLQRGCYTVGNVTSFLDTGTPLQLEA